MRWQRGVLFAAILAAHVLVVLLFLVGSAPHDAPEQEISFASLLMPERITQHRQAAVAPSRRPAETARAARSAKTIHTPRDEVPANPVQPDAAWSSAPSIDWEKAAQLAADDLVKQDAEASRQAAALSQWRSHVMPSPTVPEASQFHWDYARTHRLESSPLGLTVNLSDRCSLLISIYLMAIMGGCKIGELPVHGDLFMHMKDASASTAPADPSR